MTTIQELISNPNSLRHHAILLLSNYFSTNEFPENGFKLIAQEFCKIKIYENKEETIYQSALRHPDIFIADRERKILRLEEIKPIHRLGLYSPQQGVKRLFFIENCERLNTSAANSLLKILEEPLSSCLFILTSSKTNLVLPTILSRVQKIALSFPEQQVISIKEKFSIEDRLWIKNQIENFHLPSNKTQNMNNNELKSDKKSMQISKVIAQCEKFVKEYQAEDLRALLVTLVNEKLKENFDFMNVARIFLANISEWKNCENYHPSTVLWLIRLFLLFN